MECSNIGSGVFTLSTLLYFRQKLEGLSCRLENDALENVLATGPLVSPAASDWKACFLTAQKKNRNG